MSTPASISRSIQDVRIEIPPLSEIIDTLSLNAGYNTSVVMVGTTLLGIAAGLVGVFAMLRSRSLMGDALAHSTLPGIALAFIIATTLGFNGKSMPILLFGAAVSGVIGMVLVQAISRNTRLTEDTAIGAVLACFFGLGVVLLSYVQTMPTGGQAGLRHFILGQTAAMRLSDAVLMGGVSTLAGFSALLLFKEFRLVCFDDRFAHALGRPINTLDLVMMALVVLVIVAGLQAVGLLLVVAMLIIPPAAARFWTDRLARMALIAAIFGGLSGYLGSAASALLPRMPTGAVIVLTAGSIFSLSMLIAPRRGVIAQTIRSLSFRVRIALDHYLRSAYEAIEADGNPVTSGQIVNTHAIAKRRGWRPLTSTLLTTQLRLAGHITRTGRSVALTNSGAAQAAAITRRHRLWERFLITHADVAASHVHDAADLIEHTLSDELVKELEDLLKVDRMLPDVPPAKTSSSRPGGDS